MWSIASIAGRLAGWRRGQLDKGRALPDWSIDRPDAYCPRCGATAGPGSVTERGCAFCLDQPIVWHRLTRLGEYGPPVDEAIKAMKFAGDWARCGWFGRQMAAHLGLADPRRTLVVPVPMHRLRHWARGYNQALLIAEALAHARGLPLLPMLRRIRHTPPQSTLPAGARRRNLAGAFAARPVDLSGHDVLLVDDVKTTGSTLAGCARLLRDQGARTIHCAVVAVADPHHQSFQYW